MVFDKFKNFLVKTEILVGRITSTETRSHPIIYQRFPETLICKILKFLLGTSKRIFDHLEKI